MSAFFGGFLVITDIKCLITLIDSGYVLLPDELWEKT